MTKMDGDIFLSPEAYSRGLVIFVEALAALVLNAFVAVALYKSSKVINQSTYLYINLLVSDTAFCFISVILHGHKVITRRRWVDSMCTAEGFFVQTFEGMTVSLVFIQLLNPFRIIIMGKPAFTSKELTYILLVLWTWSSLLTASWPFIAGQTPAYVEMPSQVWCYVDFDTPTWGTLITIHLTVWVLCLIPPALAVSYWWMWYKMSYSASRRAREKQIQWLIVRQGLVLFVSFVLTWTYPTIILMGRLFGKWKVSPEQDFGVAILGLLANLLNPLILFFSNEKIRVSAVRIVRDFIRLLRRCTRRGTHEQVDGDDEHDKKFDVPGDKTTVLENPRLHLTTTATTTVKDYERTELEKKSYPGETHQMKSAPSSTTKILSDEHAPHPITQTEQITETER